MKKKNIFKPTLYLFLRLFLVGMLCFMTSPLSTKNEELLNPIFACFYYFVLMYFYIYTMWYEGCQDRIHIKSATKPSQYLPYKGFLCAGILSVIEIIIYLLPKLFALFNVRVLSIIASAVRTFSLVPYIYTFSLVSTRSLSDVSSGVIQSQGDYLWMTIILFLLLISLTVGAGIGYLTGYRDIKIFRSFIEKWHRE